jgi:hypothetical protein
MGSGPCRNSLGLKGLSNSMGFRAPTPPMHMPNLGKARVDKFGGLGPLFTGHKKGKSIYHRAMSPCIFQLG